MKIRGIIEEEAAVNGNAVKYQVKADGIPYEIISKDRQALKDIIFLRKGQSVEVDATLDDKEYISNGSVIDIKSLVT